MRKTLDKKMAEINRQHRARRAAIVELVQSPPIQFWPAESDALITAIMTRVSVLRNQQQEAFDALEDLYDMPSTSAWVEVTMLCSVAQKLGLDLPGFTDQAAEQS